MVLTLLLLLLDFGLESWGQILQPGYAVISCKPDPLDPYNITMGIKDIRQLGTLWQTPSNHGINQSGNVPAGMMWSVSSFGNNPIMSVTINQNTGDIYAATTRLYQGYIDNVNPVPAQIYKITAAGTLSLLTTLTGDWGIGYIDYDHTHNQIFATNMEDGKIYRIDASTGTNLDSFDPMNIDDGLAGMPVYGERILGIAYNTANNRVFYSVWSQNNGYSNVSNTIRSVSLNAAGTFNGGDQLEITQPNLHVTTAGYPINNPVGDIEFNNAGNKLLLGEITFYTGGDKSLYSGAHSSRVLEYSDSSGSWTLAPTIVGNEGSKYDIGEATGKSNSRGGLSWAYEKVISGVLIDNEGYIISTGDALRFKDPPNPHYVYGFQFNKITGGNVENAIIVDLDANTAYIDKYLYGDVDIYKGIQPLCTTLSALTATATPNSLATSSSSTLNVTGTSITAGVTTFSWAGTGGFTATTQNPSTGNLSTAGAYSYTVTATNANGTGTCTATATTSLTVSTVPTPCTAITAATATATPSSLATGASATLSTSATSGITAGTTTFSWSGTAGFTATTQNPSTGAIATAGGYSYTVTATNANGTGTCTATATTSLTVSTAVGPCTALFGLTATATPSSLATGSSSTLNVTGTGITAGITTFSWTGTGSFTATTQNPSTGALATAGGYSYTVTVTNANGTGTCTATATTSLTVSTAVGPCTALSGLTATATPSSLVTGSSSTLNVTGTGIAGTTTFNWAGTGGFTATTQNPSTGTLATAGGYSYTITATNANGTGTCTATATTSLTVSSTVVACINPTFTGAAVQVTCTGTTANTDGKLTISAIANGDKVGYSTGATYAGATTYSTATLISALSPTGQVVGNLANPASSQQYTIRVYNASNTCYTDQTLTLTNKNCTTPCGTPRCGTVTISVNN